MIYLNMLLFLQKNLLTKKEFLVFIFILSYNVGFLAAQTTTQSACYDKNGIAKTCLTYPKNVALNREVAATDTCGTPSETFCQIGASQDRCKICDAEKPQNRYPATDMVDFHNPTNITWWQSSSWWQMKLEGRATLATPPKVNVSITFNKLYLVSGGIRITFYSVRPQKMIIQRSTDYGKTWSSYQYFAKSCQGSYGLVADPTINATNRFQATCTEKFSRELPYVGGMVVFDPRLTRYQNKDYSNPIIQNYLAATNIKLLLEYPGTDGRENIDSASTLNQYYYAISDIVVDARCHCHGHAEYCDFKNGTELCDCKHFTAGKDCKECLPLYNNRTWMAGNETDANECQRCQCYGHASACIYDKQLGFGVCQDCKHNTTGSNCEFCVDKFYRNISKPLADINVCIPCDCFLFGVRDNGSCLQRVTGNQKLGQCNCKPGVYGRRCDQCLPGKWGFALQPTGQCLDCLCNIFGTVRSNQTCDPYTGQCECKSNIQGRTCSECKDGFYSFPTNATSKCQPCGCGFAGGFPICDKLSGTCTCRRGIEGSNCNIVSSGFYFPNFTHVKFEVEMLSQQSHEVFWLQRGYRSLFLGVGQIKLIPDQSLVYSFQVPVTHRYYVLMRYSLYPINWYNSLFLYDAESLSWNGAKSISTYTSHLDNPSEWNISVAIFDPSNALLKYRQFSIDSLSVGEANILNDSAVMQLNAGVVYRLTANYSIGRNSGTPWPFLLDSIVLMPDLTESAYYNVQSTVIKSEILKCYEQSASLSTTFALPSNCRQHVYSMSVLMYNGSLACNCFSPGLKDQSTCEKYGGQCSCKTGYGGRRCEHCLPGYYGNPSTGCFACRCSSSGSLTPVCNQTTGNCFCKTNTQDAKCGNCKAGTFSLKASNPDGCQSCYGFGHLLSCAAAKKFVDSTISSNFTRSGTSIDEVSDLNRTLKTRKGSMFEEYYVFDKVSRNDGWSLLSEDGSSVVSGLQRTANGLQYIDEGRQVVFLSAPVKYLGNQLRSYGQQFIIEMRFITLLQTLYARQWHVKLIGGGMTAVFRLYPRITAVNTTYSFRLHEKFMANETKLSEFDFKSLIGQLTAIYVGLNYFQTGSVITLQSIQMKTASSSASDRASYASHVENATCMIGYEGLSCERCDRGYTRSVVNGGPLENCVPCRCNERSRECDPQTGNCKNCRTGTAGDHCEKCMPNLLLPNCTTCMPGYWKISPNGCQPCNCYLPGTVNGSSESCDIVTGQCACNSSMNVAGRQCNQCKQNAYNISLGDLQCKACPPCYTPIEQDYIFIRHQTDLLQNEIKILSNDPTLSPSVPLDQSLAVLSVAVNSLVTKARASSSNVTSLNSDWTSMQTEMNALQNALATTTSDAVVLATSASSQILSTYNQSYASLVAISSKIVASYNQLTTFVSTRVSMQVTAVKQLSVLLNETVVFLRTVQSLSSQANTLRATAIAQVSQTIQIASLAANNSQAYQSVVTSMNSSLVSLRNLVTVAQSQGSTMQAFAEGMRSNASAVSVYAEQLRSNVTFSLPDNSQMISSISAVTTALSTQISNLDNLATSTTRESNAVEQQISNRKQTNSILNSRISTTERRLGAIKSSMASVSITSASAISSALSTEAEAVSILNTVRNFQSVSQQAAIDASIALAKVNTVLEVAYTANNVTTNVTNQLSPIIIKVNQAANISLQSNQIANTEKQTVESVYQNALKLRNETSSALKLVQSLNIQQYIDTTVTPLLTRCRNYTAESKMLLQNVLTADTQSQLSSKTAQAIAVSVVNIASSISVIPSIDRSKLTPIYDNMLRVRIAYSALDVANDLESLRTSIATIKLQALNYHSKINSLRSSINAYQIMYNSLGSLACNVPSKIP